MEFCLIKIWEIYNSKIILSMAAERFFIINTNFKEDLFNKFHKQNNLPSTHKPKSIYSCWPFQSSSITIHSKIRSFTPKSLIFLVMKSFQRETSIIINNNGRSAFYGMKTQNGSWIDFEENFFLICVCCAQ